MKLNKLLILAAIFISATLTANNPLWMRYPAISPDGSKIAFSYQGDLWIVDATGGQAKHLTTHESYDFQPVWSNDGTKIAFASDRHGNFDIFVINAEGGIPKRLTYHSAREIPSAFSPDGKSILFSAAIQDDVNNVQFPSGILSELYSVPTEGGKISMVFPTPAIDAKYNKDGSKIIYYDIKGYEDQWRKHHTSSVTRDIWIYDTATKTHKKVSSFEGEDRYPVFINENEIYYLSEKFGSTFNVVKANLNNPEKLEQITTYDKNPVRFLSIADNGTICYGYNGEIFLKKSNGEPSKVNITIKSDLKENAIEFVKNASGATDMAVSPNGDEIAFIVRGDVYVTSVEYNTTKQITNTPEQERSVSFSPDGKKILYAGERNNSWNLYQSKIARKEEKKFALATLIEEEILLATDDETYQPEYSPDGKKIAYIKDRTTFMVMDVESKTHKMILDPKYNYSYSDGDMYYSWSPDSKWMLVSYSDKNRRWSTDIGLVNIESGEIHNLTESGYSDNAPKWMMNGEMIIWSTDRHGYRSHGSWGAERDVYAMFLTKEAWDVFNMSKEEYELYKEAEKEKKEAEKKAAKEDDDKKKKKKKDDDKEKKDETFKPIKIDFENLQDRWARLTIHSSSLSDYAVDPEGLQLFYLSRFEDGFDLWVQKFKEKETKLLSKLSGYGGGLQVDKNGKYLFLFSGGRLTRIDAKSGQKKTISFMAEKYLNYPAEREYMFEHAWRQVREKFYDPEIHGLDWDYYKENYKQFLPHINNNYDFADVLGEMLGELNGSHTGARYSHRDAQGDATASLGVLLDWNYEGPGVKIAEIIDKSPLIQEGSKISNGAIIEKIDGEEIAHNSDYYKMLNHRSGKTVLLSLYNPQTKNRWEETAKAMSGWGESRLLYERWVKNRRAEVERLSNGRLGYVHVQGMNSNSFREVYSEALGRYSNKEALIVDTRFNGGGWLHDDLATFLGGKEYAKFMPRGQYIGSEPINKWYKPSIVVIGEGNYSDAHGFPFTYKALGIGKLIGMPVPGTMTAVWWESQIDRSIVFGIPQMGVQDMNGNYLENKELHPDIKVLQEKEIVIQNRDQQIEAAVKELIQQLK